jgi:hypothetical protein
MLCDLFLYDKSFSAIQGFYQDSIVSGTSLEIKGFSTLHSLCSTFISAVDCPMDVRRPHLSDQLCSPIGGIKITIFWPVYFQHEVTENFYATVQKHFEI